MASKLWGMEGPDIDWKVAIHSTKGQRVDLVCQVACWDFINNDCLVVIFPGNKTARLTGLNDFPEGTQSITVLDALCISDSPQLAFEADGSSVVFEHETIQAQHFRNMLELCSGAGIGTFGFSKAGIEAVVAVEHSQALADAYKCLHPDVCMIVGDIMARHVKIQVCSEAKRIGVLFSGFPCQPYSRGGSQNGGLDPRALPLHSVLELALLCRIPVIALECVPDAATNRFVRKILQSYCHQCAFHMTETLLRLESVWPCRRERWWVVLSASTLGPIPLRGLPQFAFPNQIKQILPQDLHLSPEDLEQLILTPEEHARFLQFQPDLQKMLLRRCGTCQTILHSLGSQMVGCRCGCRSLGFSDQTLQSRGVFGFLMKAPGTTMIGYSPHEALRHPHPTEVALLTATPVVPWPTDLRLMLAGLGQQATPTHALWIGCQIQSRILELVHGQSDISPLKQLDLYVESMLSQSKELFPTPIDEVVEEELPCPAESSSKAVIIAASDFWPKRHTGDAESFSIFTDDSVVPAVIRLSHSTLTVGHLRAAEVGLLPAIGVIDVLDSLTGLALPNSEMLAGKGVIIRSVLVDPYLVLSGIESPIASDDHEILGKEQIAVSPTIPFHVETGSANLPHGDKDGSSDAMMANAVEAHEEVNPTFQPLDPLASLQSNELVQLTPPLVPNLQTLAGLISPNMTAESRLQIFMRQDTTWADDEIRWHLMTLLGKVGSRTKILLDPLLATHVVQSNQTALLYRWAQQIGEEVKVIVTAVWTHGHWTPFAWTWTPECMVAHSWDVQGSQQSVNVLHDGLAKAFGCRTFMVHIAFRQFAINHMCGVCAVRWIDHFVSGKMLPSDQHEVEYLNSVAKEKFADYLSTDMQVCRPWIWADGLDAHVQARLIELLLQHGVPQDAVESRAKIVTNGLSVSAVQKAVTGTAPWRS